jgi:transcriptional regulator with XRE-family HTH domain
MNYIRRFRKKLGLTQEGLAESIGVHETAVAQWEKGIKEPTEEHKDKLAKVLSCTIYDLFPDLPLPETPELPPMESPFAKYKGKLLLGANEIDCYVLDTGERVISLSATVRALTGTNHGQLKGYLGVDALQGYLDLATIDSSIIEFNIPQTGIALVGKGIKAEIFLDICRAYVGAMADGNLKTTRQREIAIQSSVLISSCAKVGLIALIDEATGYQYERSQDALQLKLRLFISEELRAWERTFPDELWEEFGRLTSWTKPLHIRPKWWGKLVMELIYDALDPDVANYLRTNAPPPKYKQNYHQWMTENYGLKQLITHIHQIIGVAKTCNTIQELRQKVAQLYGKDPIQLTLYLPNEDK